MKEHQKHWLKPSKWIEQEPKKKKKFFTFKRNFAFAMSFIGLFYAYFPMYMTNSWDMVNNVPKEVGIYMLGLMIIGVGAGMMIYAD